MVEQMKPPFKVESHYKPKLRDDTPDDEWLSLVGENGWTVISHDCRFHKESPALVSVREQIESFESVSDPLLNSLNPLPFSPPFPEFGGMLGCGPVRTDAAMTAGICATRVI
jgi:hypothetical protein